MVYPSNYREWLVTKHSRIADSKQSLPPAGPRQQDFYIDLLFYHTRLHCYVVVELKTGDFKPEYAGQINFYLSALDDIVKAPEDNPSIGIILCATKDRILAEYALRDMKKPIGVAEWKTKLTRSLPAKLRKNLPTIEEIEAELMKEEDAGGRRKRGNISKRG